MLSCNDAPLCQSFGRPKEGRRNTCLRQLSCLLAGSVTLTSFWSPGAAGRNSVPPEDGLVTQLWPGFSRATPVLRTIRLWVIITLAFTPKFSCVYFTPQTLQSVCFLGPLVFFLLFVFLLSFHVIVHTSRCRPCHRYLSLLFLTSVPLSLLLLFLGYFKLWREFFSCDYSSFFQF